MAIQNTRSNVSGRVPNALQDGQIGINQADGVLFSRNPDGTIKRTLLPKRTAVLDAAFSVRAFDMYIGVASLTASRTIALPAASAYPAGSPLTIADESGSCSPSVVLTIAANGSDTVNALTSVSLNSPNSVATLVSDGASKWTASLPAAAAPSAVLYVTQPLTSGQQDQARYNISGAIAAAPTATTNLVALDFDRDQFVTGTSTLVMPATVAPGWRTGAIVNDNASTGTVTLAIPTGHSVDGITNGSVVLPPYQRARLSLVSASTWRSQSLTDPSKIVRSNAAQSFSDAELAQLLSNIGLPSLSLGQCQFVANTATQCSLNPVGGGLLTINGSVRRIPAGGVTISNSIGGQPLAASTLYYVYAYMNSSVMALEFSTTPNVIDANGNPIKSGDSTRTCVGMIFANASSQFQDDLGFRYVASYFNRRNRSIGGDVTIGGSSSSTVAIGLGAVFGFLTWNEAIEFTIAGSMTNNAGGQAVYAQIAVDATLRGQSCVYNPAGSGPLYAPLAQTVSLELPAGFHSLTAYGRVSGNTGTWNVSAYGILRI